MANFLEIPPQRLEPETLQGLLEEFASRDGTDYGLVEKTLDEKVARLSAQLAAGTLCLLYDADSEHWDLLSREQADELLYS